MRNQKGMGYLMLMIWIVIIILAVAGISYFARTELQKEKVETYETDMLLLQGKVKVLSQEATVQKEEEFLKGKKLQDYIEQEEIKTLLENNVISQEDPNFSNYYIIEKETLEEMGLTTINLKEGFYIVNYDTEEIIYSKGMKVGDTIYYKLSELKVMRDEQESAQ